MTIMIKKELYDLATSMLNSYDIADGLCETMASDLSLTVSGLIALEVRKQADIREDDGLIMCLYRTVYGELAIQFDYAGEFVLDFKID